MKQQTESKMYGKLFAFIHKRAEFVRNKPTWRLAQAIKIALNDAAKLRADGKKMPWE